MKLNIPDTYKLLYLCEVGSSLFGTRRPESDTDYRGVYTADLKSIILKKDIEQTSKSTGNDKRKNEKDDVDISLFSLQRFLSDVSNGETGAIDLLFSVFVPDLHQYCDPEFKKLIEDNYPKLLSKKPKAFVGYCLSQTKKYGIKGERLNSLIQAHTIAYAYLSSFSPELGSKLRLNDLLVLKSNELLKLDYVELTTVRNIDGSDKEYLSVLGKEYEKSIKATHFLKLLSDHINNYGERSRAALNGKDLKSISHAVRVIDELTELLTTGKILFPLKNAQFIKDIKTGNIGYDIALSYIEAEMLKIDALLVSSSLPEQCDTETIEKIIFHFLPPTLTSL